MRPWLVLVFDRAALGEGHVSDRITAMVDAGVDRLQVRDRALEADALFALTRDVSKGARAASRPAQVVVNRRVDVALAAGADGVHLGFDALGVAEARALLGADASIGVSCHSIEEVRAAADAAANHVHLAPIFDPISKRAERPALGLDVLARACGAGVPVIAQGGLSGAQARDALMAGAAGVAVTGCVLGARDPVEAAARLRGLLDRHIDQELDQELDQHLDHELAPHHDHEHDPDASDPAKR